MGWMEITTAANTSELVRQGRRRELREQGRIGHNASNAEVRAAEKAIRGELAAAHNAQVAARETREAADQALADVTADPKGMFLFGLCWVGLFAVVLAIALLAGSSWWSTAAGWGVGLAVLITLVLTVQEANGRARHRRRQVS